MDSMLKQSQDSISPQEHIIYSLLSTVPEKCEIISETDRSPRIKQEPHYQTSLLDQKIPFLCDLIKWETEPERERQMKQDGDVEKEAAACSVMKIEAASRVECPLFSQLPHLKVAARDMDLTGDGVTLTSNIQEKYSSVVNPEIEYKVLQEVDYVSQFDSVSLDVYSDWSKPDNKMHAETSKQGEDKHDKHDVDNISVSCVSKLTTGSSRGDKLDQLDDCSDSYGSFSHLKTHVNRNMCDDCGVGCSSQSELQKHKKTHIKVQSFKCDDCGAKFGTFSFLKQHMKSHVQEKPGKHNVCSLNWPSKTPMITYRRTHIATIQQKRTHIDTIQHKRTRTGKKLAVGGQRTHTVVGASITASAPEPGSLEHKEECSWDTADMCDVCGAAFSYRCNKLRHRKLHTGEKPFKCGFCGLALASSYSLQEHTRTHTGEKPYTCQICDAAFSSKGNMLRHKRVHTQEKPHLCDVCGASFTLPWHLTEHKRSHTGEKPYRCHYCDVRFALQGHLKKHIVIHTGERNYKCDDCGKKFARQTNLHSHRRKHQKNKL